jgi:tetratricopeptide (TPR) repeat protein
MPRHSWRGLASVALLVWIGLGPSAFAQVETPATSETAPPPKVSPPSPRASIEQLESQGDMLRQGKMYLDAVDYYDMALQRVPAREAMLQNKIGITNLEMGKLDAAKKYFEQAVKTDKTFAEAYNNLGVLYYMQKKYSDAVKQYEKAVKQRESASFYANMANAHFARKDYDKAVAAFQQALALDPQVLDRRSNLPGYSAQLPAPEDRAAFSFVLAKLYSKKGDIDRALQNLRMAIEDGYKDIGKVYDEPDFEPLRKDPRFAALMAAKPAALK